MWVICAGMMRSGSTLQYQIAKALVEESGVGEGLGFSPAVEFERLLVREGRDDSRVRVVKCHDWLPWERAAAEEDRRVLYSYRDLRDVVVSWMKKAGLTFQEVMADGYVERLLENDYLWTRATGVLVSRYESLVEDLAGEVGRIAAHLEIPVDRATAARHAATYSFERQRQKIASFDFEREGVHVGGHVLYDAESLLHHNHIHTGGEGMWRSALTPRQVEVLEEMAGGWLREGGYALSSELSVRSSDEHLLELC